MKWDSAILIVVFLISESTVDYDSKTFLKYNCVGKNWL